MIKEYFGTGKIPQVPLAHGPRMEEFRHSTAVSKASVRGCRHGLRTTKQYFTRFSMIPRRHFKLGKGAIRIGVSKDTNETKTSTHKVK
jgi:hypothetical protein